MNIKINIEELRYILDHTPASHNIMLTGRHGIGKSEILTAYFSEKGLNVIALFLGQMSDPGDLIGLPDKSGEITVFRPPYWFPIDGKPIVLFLDELNRARPEVLQTIMNLALNRKLAGRSLPKGSRVIAAVNEGEAYQLTDLDPALVSRFNIFRFEPSVEEWLQWAQANELDYRVVSFIRENGKWLDGDPNLESDEETGLDKTPDRRAWKRVSDVLKGQPKLSRKDKKLISSIIGIKAASLFATAISQSKQITARDLLRDYAIVSQEFAKFRPHDFQVLSEDIYQYLTVTSLEDSEKEIAAENLQKYITYLQENRKNEAYAGFASLFHHPRYEKAVDFMLKNCPDVVMSLFSFTAKVR